MRLLFLERDIDKALRRMALEEEKNLTQTMFYTEREQCQDLRRYVIKTANQ